MKLIHMLKDWDRTEDEDGRHILITGNTFPVTNAEAAAAVDGGYAEYVGGELSTKKAPAAVDGVNVEKPTMLGTGKGPTKAKKPREPNKGLALGSGGGEPSPNTLAGTEGEDAPA